MPTRVTNWINEVNTTSFRILASVIGAIVNITAIQIAMLFFRWEPTAMQKLILLGEAAVLLTMMGFDVLQFIAKRFSHTDYVAAKQGPSPVTVEPPSTVVVTRPSDSPAAPPVAVTPRTPEKGDDP